jgi:hypothetical protein
MIKELWTCVQVKYVFMCMCFLADVYIHGKRAIETCIYVYLYVLMCIYVYVCVCVHVSVS